MIGAYSSSKSFSFKLNHKSLPPQNPFRISTGISSTTIILAHLIVRLLLCHLNVALLLLLTKLLFYGPISTPILYPFALLLAQSLTGLSHGMMISAMCHDFFMGAVLSNGVLLMMFILSGVLWDRESLPVYLK